MNTTNCKNCGAPLKNWHCAYCGTPYPSDARTTLSLHEVTALINVNHERDMALRQWFAEHHAIKTRSASAWAASSLSDLYSAQQQRQQRFLDWDKFVQAGAHIATLFVR